MITDLFGLHDPKIHQTMASKIVEQLQRADEILEKLIDMGADDKFIVEACARVDMLKEQINKTTNEKVYTERLWKVDEFADVMEEKLACPCVLAGDSK